MIKKQFKQLKYNIKLKKITKIENNNFAKNNFVLDVPLIFKNPFKVSIKNKKSYIINCFKIAIDLAKKTILQAKYAGADCVKFQSFTPQSLFSKQCAPVISVFFACRLAH